MSKRRKFSLEFKQGAVEQTYQPGVTCAQVGRELEIGAILLTRWRREAEVAGSAAFGGTGSARDAELMRLKRELARVKNCLLYTSPSPRDLSTSRMPSSA